MWMAAVKFSSYCVDTVVGHLVGVAGTASKLAAVTEFADRREQAEARACDGGGAKGGSRRSGAPSKSALRLRARNEKFFGAGHGPPSGEERRE
jgi:hypothetical protein